VDLAYEDVRIPSELGPLPAWLVPGERPTWILLVHGFHATREKGLRVLSTLARLGFPALVMCYCNDAGAPKSPDHFYHLGDTEWRDIEAGVRPHSQGVPGMYLSGLIRLHDRLKLVKADDNCNVTRVAKEEIIFALQIILH
jgi:hypothetical protein